jgi:Fur family transcriptional regulator, ferric uptake regulator
VSRARDRDDSISLATAYRSLAALVEAGLVRKLALESGPARYEMMPATDHDHLLDVDTGALTELVSPELDALRERLLAALGLRLVSCHSVMRVRRLES